jgi:hypothetical protein
MLGRIVSRGAVSGIGGGEQVVSAADAGALVPGIDWGDHRQYTAFATACAGGHA